MNLKNLKKLQYIAKNISILYVESDNKQHSKISKILKKIFPVVYQAYNGKDAYDKFKQFNTNIVLTDTELTKKSSLELIVDIQEIDPLVNIIVLSELTDDMMLLQTIDLDIKAFLFKPFDIDKLVTTLLNVLLQSYKKDIDDECLYTLNNIQNQNLKFINSYNDIEIKNDGEIISIENNEIIIDVPISQNLSIQNQNKTIINIDDKKYIKAQLLYIDKIRKYITLINPKFVEYKVRNSDNKRVKLGKDFKVSLHYHHKVIEATALNISFDAIAILIKDSDIKFNLNDNIDLTLGFEIDGVSSLVKEKKFIKIFANGEILRINPLKTGMQMIISLKVKKAGERVFKNYLKQKYHENIQEFKRLLRK
ncbi:MAG: response regulator [Campylobacterota bacterium]|nr:response regulator [Campylobacterota bacterium]